MKVGLLPLYIQLYDETCPFMRPRVERFYNTIAEKLGKYGLEIIKAPVCRLSDEFAAAVARFENEGAQAIITLHLAYSPSLESIETLAGTKLPILVLDTTASYQFDASTDAAEIMYNHGIHGVQDMCNMLKRRGKPYRIFAGHYEKSDVLDRLAGCCRGLMATSAFRGSRIGLVGNQFAGMGDFQVPFEELETAFGFKIIKYDAQEMQMEIAAVTAEEIGRERRADHEAFAWDDSVTDELYDRTARVSLAFRKWMIAQKIDAVTVNFLETEDNPGLPVMPFTECSKAMARGTGFAGEGDVITAALCGAVLKVFPLSTFTEMFCPDWRGGSVFLSHMGEMNYRVCSGKPVLTEMNFPYTSAQNPAVAYGTLMPGKAAFINLAPCGGGKYTLILAPGEVLAVHGENNMARSVNGWFKPQKPLPEFLEEFSRSGGTHHSVLCYEDCMDSMACFASEMGFECVVI